MKKFLPFVLILFLSFQANSEIIYNSNGFDLSAINGTWDIDGDGDTELEINSPDNNPGFITKSPEFVILGYSFLDLSNLTPGFNIVSFLYGGYQYYTAEGLPLFLGPNPVSWNFNLDVPGYFAFRFEGQNDTNDKYGWARGTFLSDTTSLRIHEWAYENKSNIFLNVGLVPEPTTSSLLLLGASGLAKRRLRRK